MPDLIKSMGCYPWFSIWGLWRPSKVTFGILREFWSPNVRLDPRKLFRARVWGRSCENQVGSVTNSFEEEVGPISEASSNSEIYPRLVALYSTLLHD